MSIIPLGKSFDSCAIFTSFESTVSYDYSERENSAKKTKRKRKRSDDEKQLTMLTKLFDENLDIKAQICELVGSLNLSFNRRTLLLIDETIRAHGGYERLKQEILQRKSNENQQGQEEEEERVENNKKKIIQQQQEERRLVSDSPFLKYDKERKLVVCKGLAFKPAVATKPLYLKLVR